MANRMLWLTEPKPNRIKSVRLSLVMSQERAGELCGVTKMTWSNWESGRHPMPGIIWAAWKHVAGVQTMPEFSANPGLLSITRGHARARNGMPI